MSPSYARGAHSVEDVHDHPGISVRLIRPDEHDAVARSLLAAYEHDYDIGESYRANILDVPARAAEHETWVAVDRETGALLGSVVTPRPGRLLAPVARDGELDFRLLGVDPSARRRGIGELLVDHVIGLARRRGATRVVMNSGGNMTPAHALYEKLGFRVLRERVRVFENGHVSLAFGLDLTPSAIPEATSGVADVLAAAHTYPRTPLPTPTPDRT